MLNRITVVVLIVIGLAVTHAAAEPSRPIAKMMDTPASTFDVFLFRLYEQSKCFQGWFGNRKNDDKPDLCMTTIKYKFDDNFIVMNFIVREKYEKMAGFRSSSDKQKESMLKALLSDVATSVGVEPQGTRLGMIQLTPIREGWSTKAFEETETREEIANRTVIHLRANIGGFVYTVTRDHHGNVTFDKEKTTIPEY